MIKREKEFIKKRIMALVLVFLFGLSVLAGCGKEATKEKGTEEVQLESSSELEETEKKDEESSFTVESERETECADSTETQTETEGTQAETSKETTTESNSGNNTGENNTNKNNTNNTGKNNTSKSDTTQTDKADIGLGKESYQYIVGGTSSQNSKEMDLAKGIIKKIIKSGMNDFDKVKAINDYMILNVSYDMENYKKHTIPASSYTALGAMEKNIAVCAGYAKMFRALAIAAGLECTYITGDTPYGYHAWNQVKVDGKWYNIDVTWNDPDCETKENGHYYCGCYEYFLLSNEDFEKKHTPRQKVNSTGSSRDLEAFKLGCPYDGAVPYCETQEEFDKLVKEMVASNTMSKRILTVGYKKEEMVLNALKKLGIYSNAKVKEKDSTSVYLSSTGKLRKFTIDISLGGASFEEVKNQKITSVDSAKKVLTDSFASYKKPSSEYERDNSVHLYANGALAHDISFQAELVKWACYEKKMNLSFAVLEKQVGSDVYDIIAYYNPKTADEGANEIITSTKEMEAAIKRMFQYGHKKIHMYISPGDYKLTGESNAARNEFNKKFSKGLSEKYCLEYDVTWWNVEENRIDITFAANGHDVEYQEWEIAKEATCVSEGLEVKMCKICNKYGEQRAIPKNDNHSSYWDQKGDSRTQKCNACSYVGITEVCMGGVWGYFDEAAAKEELDAINRQRAAIQKCAYDEWGNPLYAFSPPPLVVSNELIDSAKEKLVILNEIDFERLEGCDYAIRFTPYSNTYKRKINGSKDKLYDEAYDKIGIVCFKYDYHDDASRFCDIYVMDLGEVE